eukprot:TRINITY_DN8776_c0_g1_i1.p1 TRINITY_DN8776_c0_g1~~TRINITY_DN8776_c0_g1_i1.p1  ORF type:complete len:456 (+),score=96.43 TRINITY_DN8776_c0_g1_i1:104-1471(+)
MSRFVSKLSERVRRKNSDGLGMGCVNTAAAAAHAADGASAGEGALATPRGSPLRPAAGGSLTRKASSYSYVTAASGCSFDSADNLLRCRVMLSRGEQRGARAELSSDVNGSVSEVSPDTVVVEMLDLSAVSSGLTAPSTTGEMWTLGSPLQPVSPADPGNPWGCTGLPFDWVDGLCDHCDEPQKIGAAEFGPVYAAGCRQSGEAVAVKVFERAKMATQDQWQAVLAEVAIHRELRHEHVIELRRVTQTPRELHVVMSLGDANLLEYMQQRGTALDEGAAAVVASQLLSALAYLHGQHVVHRDVKPENVVVCMRDSALTCMLCDFGWALRFDGPAEQATVGGPAGTVLYAAPEVLEGAAGGGRQTTAAELTKIDVYSLGVVLFCLLYGYNPFGDTESPKRRRSAQRSPPPELQSGVNCLGVQQLIRELLTELPPQRPTARMALATAEVLCDGPRRA